MKKLSLIRIFEAVQTVTNDDLEQFSREIEDGGETQTPVPASQLPAPARGGREFMGGPDATMALGFKNLDAEKNNLRLLATKYGLNPNQLIQIITSSQLNQQGMMQLPPQFLAVLDANNVDLEAFAQEVQNAAPHTVAKSTPGMKGTEVNNSFSGFIRPATNQPLPNNSGNMIAKSKPLAQGVAPNQKLSLLQQLNQQGQASWEELADRGMEIRKGPAAMGPPTKAQGRRK